MDRMELEARVGQGLSIAELAAQFGCCKTTIRYWLRKYQLTTQRTGRRSDGVNRICASHGEGHFVREASGYYRCSKCRSEAVARRRRRVKEVLVAEAGGRCVLCGYSKTARALEFHHLDPSIKKFGLSSGGITMSLEAARAEAAKCVLLCSNCHAEVEDGLADLPIQLGRLMILTQESASALGS